MCLSEKREQPEFHAKYLIAKYSHLSQCALDPICERGWQWNIVYVAECPEAHIYLNILFIFTVIDHYIEWYKYK